MLEESEVGSDYIARAGNQGSVFACKNKKVEVVREY